MRFVKKTITKLRPKKKENASDSLSSRGTSTFIKVAVAKVLIARKPIMKAMKIDTKRELLFNRVIAFAG